MASTKSRARRAGVQVTGADNLSKLAARLRPLTQQKVIIGVQGDAELALIAGVHEYGSVKMSIPARSFVLTGRKKGQVPIGKLVRAGVAEIARGRRRIGDMLDEVGRVGLDKMQQNFDRINDPPLSARYARSKIGRRLLQREQDLRDSLTYDVVPRSR
ncbi:hypothetical protein PA598K_01342 [Paenibacillus sp. 598K]|uniref:hypothetical protein n=1 Tax=Paenibacillus sp. 598K TaxID=1117987 RepID=UPI000FF9F8AC|nr:hypothetical protein [Paenibacillus sp. 598K]GBF73057.1 hypothetical protein PA598K_01342 [Paenibacillus sp. 598K]